MTMLCVAKQAWSYTTWSYTNEKFNLKKNYACTNMQCPYTTCLYTANIQITNLHFTWQGANQGASVICESQDLNAQRNLFPQCGHSSGNSSECSFICSSTYFFPEMIYHTHYRFWVPGAHSVSSNALDIKLLTCTHGHILDKYMYNICQSEHFYEPQRHTSHGTVFHRHHT